jgi:hypothetical protein
MALTGKLSELSPPELLQLLSLTRKTGKLVLTHRERQGVVVFRKGKIVFAASDALRSAFGATLAAGRVVADSRLIEEVERWLPGAVTDSGTFLVEYREAGAGTLNELVRQQIESTVRELVEWETGAFRFETIELPESEEISLDAGWFALEGGVDSDELVLDALTKLDEGERQRWERELAEAAIETAEPQAEGESRSEISAAFEVLVDQETGEISWIPASFGAPQPERDLSRLRRLIDEAREMQGMSPDLTAEVALLILRYAAQVVNRGVLLAVLGDTMQGIGQFGLRFADADARVRQLRIPLEEPSPFAEVVASGRAFVGRPPESPWTSYLLERIGGSASCEVALVPLEVEGAVVAVLYGDNLPFSTRLEAVDVLEILMREVARGVEKARGGKGQG